MIPTEITKDLLDAARGSNFSRLTAGYIRDHCLVRLKDYLIKNSGLMSFLWKVDQVYDSVPDASRQVLDFLYDVYSGYYTEKVEDCEDLQAWVDKHRADAAKIPFDELMSFDPDLK